MSIVPLVFWSSSVEIEVFSMLSSLHEINSPPTTVFALYLRIDEPTSPAPSSVLVRHQSSRSEALQVNQTLSIKVSLFSPLYERYISPKVPKQNPTCIIILSFITIHFTSLLLVVGCWLSCWLLAYPQHTQPASQDFCKTSTVPVEHQAKTTYCGIVNNHTLLLHILSYPGLLLTITLKIIE